MEFATIQIMKTKEEHLKYCIGIIQRGDKIKDVIRYLNYQKVDEETHDEILNEIYQLLEDEKIDVQQVEKKRKFKFSYDLVIGIIFMLAGLYFIRPFWDKGVLLALPLDMVFIKSSLMFSMFVNNASLPY